MGESLARWAILEAVSVVVFLADAVLIQSRFVDDTDLRLHRHYISFIGPVGDRILASLTFNPIESHGELFALEITCFVLSIGGYLVARGRARSALALVVAVVGALGLEYVLKSVIQRPGPALDSGSIGLRTFPSGHTAVGVTLFLAGAYLVSRGAHERVRVPVVVAGTVLAFGVVLSAMTFHLPSEVAGGIALSGAWLAVLLPLSHYFTREPRGSRPTFTSSPP